MVSHVIIYSRGIGSIISSIHVGVCSLVFERLVSLSGICVDGHQLKTTMDTGREK